MFFILSTFFKHNYESLDIFSMKYSDLNLFVFYFIFSHCDFTNYNQQ